MEITLQIPDEKLDELLRKYAERCANGKNTLTPIEEPDIISLNEVCTLTGRRKPWVYKKTSEDNSDFPSKRFGRRLVFSRKEVLDWLDKNTIRKQSNDEIVSKQLRKSATKKLNK